MTNNWNPFFALANTRSEIDDAIDKRNDVSMKELSEDKLLEVQEIIVESFKNQSCIKLTYYYKKRFVDEIGVISKIDVYSKNIHINNCQISFVNIIDAKSLDKNF